MFLMKRIIIAALASAMALVACSKDDQLRLEQLQKDYAGLQAKAVEDVPAAADPASGTDPDSFAFSFDQAGYGVDAGQSVSISYSLPAAASVEVSAKNGWSASVTASSATEGVITVSAPDPASPCDIVATAKAESGSCTAVTLPLMLRDPYSDATRTRAQIMGYYSLKPFCATPENFQKLADAGLTMVTVETGDPDYREQLRYAHQAGMRAVPIIGWCAGRYADNPGGYTGLDDLIAELKSYPATCAYHVCDEPDVAEIPRLKLIREKIESLDPVNPVYINLNPDGSEHSLGVYYYRDYIEAFARDCGVKFISFDMYPIYPDGTYMRDWHKCLTCVSEVTRQYGIPFWAFAATCCIDLEQGNPVRGRPTVENLRLQVYTDLAYGAQVVQYFTIQQYGGTDFAPMMANGQWSEAYDIMKEATLQVQKRGFAFDGCHIKQIGFKGTPPSWGNNYGDWDLPEAVSSLATSGTAMVSLLENKGNEYLAIVNQSFTSKITAKVGFAAMAYTIERDGSFTEHTAGSESFTIDEGDLMLIKVK